MDSFQTQATAGYSERVSSGDTDVQKESSALNAFYHLISFLALSSFATGSGMILFQLINKMFIDPLDRGGYLSYFGDYSQWTVKYGMSSIIIAGPIFFFMTFVIWKKMQNGAIDPSSRARQWAIFLSILMAGAVVMSDLTSLVFGFLSGEFGARFVMKTLAILLLAGLIFSYYFIDAYTRTREQTSLVIDKIFFLIGVVLAIIIFIAGSFIIDGPLLTRYRQADVATVTALQSVDQSVQQYYQQKKGVLPTSLEEVKKSDIYSSTLSADVIGKVKYTNKGKDSYSLCADFNRSNLKDTEESLKQAGLADLSYSGYGTDKWKHDKGQVCFDESISANISAQFSVNNQQMGLNNSIWDNISKRVDVISSVANQAVPLAVICRDAGGTILSGIGGSALCSNDAMSVWPSVDICGGAAGTKWTVKNGDKDAFDFVIQCSNDVSCNGPNNLLCTSSGCRLSGTCSSKN